MIPLYNANMPDQTKAMVDSSDKPSATWWLMLRAVWSRTGLGSGVPIQVDNNLTATGSSQADALQLNLDWNEVLTATAGSGVILLSVQPGQTQVVFNGSGTSIGVYPPVSMQIDSLGVNAAYPLGAGMTQFFGTYSIGQIRSVQLG